MQPFTKAIIPESEIEIAAQGILELWKAREKTVVGLFPGASEEQVLSQAREYVRETDALHETWLNDKYQVQIRVEHAEPPTMLHLSIKRRDREAIEKLISPLIVDLGYVGTLSEEMLGLITVPTQHLKSFWESIINQPAIKMPSTARCHSKELSPVCISAAVHVVNSKERKFFDPTTSTFSAIASNNTEFKRNSFLFAHDRSVLLASGTPLDSLDWLATSTGFAKTTLDSLFIPQTCRDGLLMGAGLAGFLAGTRTGTASDAGNVRLFWSCHSTLIRCMSTAVNEVQFNNSGWRELQQIKNLLVGPECEAVELYPAESRLVDSANQFHLWCVVDPAYRFPFGFNARCVSESPVGKSKNRPFEKG